MVGNHRQPAFGLDRPPVYQYPHFRRRLAGRSAKRVCHRHRVALGLCPVVRRRDGDHRRLRFLNVGGLRLAPRFGIGLPQGFPFILRLEDFGNNIGAVVSVAEAGHGEKVGGLVSSMIDVPADEVFRAGGTVIVARWRPQHPAFLVGMGKEIQQFLSVRHPVPADRAVAERGHCQFAIPADVDGICHLGSRYLPFLRSVFVEQAQMPCRPQQKADMVRGNRQTEGGFVGFQFSAAAHSAWAWWYHSTPARSAHPPLLRAQSGQHCHRRESVCGQ